MAKKRATKKKKATSNSFIDIIFSLLIVGALVYGGYYFLTKDSSFFDKAVENIKEKVKEVAETSSIEDEDEDITPSDEDDMNMQFEDEITESISENTESTSGDIDTFEDQILYYAKRYNGLQLRVGADPDTDKATDNSHLICKIYQHAAENSGMKFKGYMQMDEIRRNIHQIKNSSLRNGDLLKLKNGMLAMVIDLSSKNDYKLIYASGSKNSVVITNYDQLKHYWLKPENFDAFYRLNEDVLR